MRATLPLNEERRVHIFTDMADIYKKLLLAGSGEAESDSEGAKSSWPRPGPLTSKLPRCSRGWPLRSTKMGAGKKLSWRFEELREPPTNKI